MKKIIVLLGVVMLFFCLGNRFLAGDEKMETTLLSGTVCYSDGKPAAGAIVQALSWSNWYGPVATATTDEQGRYSFKDIVPGSYWFYVKKGNFFNISYDIQIDGGKTVSDKNITVEEGCRVKGKVTEEETGKPMAGVLLIMDDGDRVNSNEEGEFLFEGIAKKDHRVMAVKENYARSFASFDSKNREEVKTEIKLKPGGTIRGVVTDEKGNPLAGAEVGDLYSGSIWHSAFGKTKTNEKGEYEIKGYGLEKPIWAVQASYPGLLENTQNDITFPKGSNIVVVNFQLGLGWEIKGKVTDVEGKPVKEALVGYGSGTSYVHYKDTTTDEKGEFRLKNLDSRKDLVLIQAKGFSPELMEATPGIGDDIPSLTVALKPGHFIAGKIVDEDDKPIKGVSIATMAPCDLPTSGCSGSYRYLRPRTATDEGGNFRLEDLPAAGVFVDIYTAGYSDVRDKRLDVDKADYEIVLLQPGQISGKVLDAETRQPVKDFNVRLSFPTETKADDIRSGFSAYLSSSGADFHNEDGTFTISGLTTNAVYKVIVAAPGYAYTYIDRVKVKPVSQKEFDTAYELKSGVGVSGVVVDSVTGKAVPKAKVTVLDPIGRYSSWFQWNDRYEESYAVKTVETDEKGRFIVSGLSPVKVDVLVTQSDYSRSRFPEVDLSQEQNQKELKLSIDPAGTIEGIVYGQAGKTLAKVGIRVELRGSNLATLTSYGYVSTDENGYYRFESLPSGTYNVSRQEENKRYFLKEITLKPGEVKKVDFGLEEGVRLFGKVTHEGQPLAEIKISVVNEDIKSVIASTVTDKNGDYEIKGLESKEYKIQAQKGEWVDPNKLYLEKKVVLTANNSEVNFTFPEAVMSGMIKDRVTGEPVANMPVQAFKRTLTSEIWGEDHIGTTDKWSWKPLRRVSTSPEGTFKLENLDSGEYIVGAGDYGAQNRVASELIVLKEKENFKDLLLEINQPGKLKVKVVNSDTGRPGEGASLVLFTHDDYGLYYCSPRKERKDAGSTYDNPPYSTENGEVLFENLKPGNYYVMAEAPGRLFSEKEEVKVPAEGTAALTLKLKPAGKVTFNLIEPSAAPIPGILYMTLRLKRSDQAPALKSLFGNQNGTYGFFKKEGGRESFVLDILEKGEYQADIEIYREGSSGVITSRAQKPLYATSETFNVESEKETTINIDMNRPQKDTVSFGIFFTDTDSASTDALMHILAGNDKSISVVKAGTIKDAFESKAEVLILQVGRDNSNDMKEINDDIINALKGRKVIGIGLGAAQLFGKLGLEINDGMCAQNPRDYTPKISIEKDGLIEASGIKEPIIAFDLPHEKEQTFDINCAMFIPRKDPMCSVVEAIARWVGSRPGEENYAPIVRQGNYVMIGLDAPVNTWTADYRKFFHELAIALRDRKSEPFSVAKWEVTKPGIYNFNLAKSLSTDELFYKNMYFQFTRPGKLVVHLEQKGSNNIMLIFGGKDTTNHWIRKDAFKGEPLEISVDITAKDIQNIGQKYWRLDVANFDWEHEAKCSLRIDYQ